MRRAINGLMLGLTGLCTIAVLVPLAMILFQVVHAGVGGLSAAFFTQLPAPPGEAGGGMANAIVGTFELLALAVGFGIPLGLVGGIYVAELPGEKWAMLVQYLADVLTGVPTIVTGLFVYAWLVVPMHRFSGLAGGVALALVMLPVVLRASEEVLRALPGSYREAAIALGATRWQVLGHIVLRAGKSGLVSAGLLGVARVAGETAPLLLTSLNSTQWTLRPDQPMASLTVQIYNYAIAPYDNWHQQAWAGALTLIAIIIILSLLARMVGGKLGGRAGAA